MFYLCTPDRFMEAKSFREVTRSLTDVFNFVAFYRAYGISKVDKGPKEVLNPEIQKVAASFD